MTPQRRPIESRQATGLAGRFTESLMHRVRESLSFDGFTVEIKSIELGDNPFNESLSMDFRFAPERYEANLPSARRIGPVLTFTFSADISVEENIADFREFVQSQALLADNALD